MQSRVYRLVVGVVLSLSLFGVASFAQASGLTATQVSAIIGLLQSFGADQSVINNVSAALGGTSSASASCVTLSHNFSLGATDATTNGEVTKLQQFLEVSPATGYFGASTLQAVQAWQSAHGIAYAGTPATTGYGFVGPHTRAMMGCTSAATTPTVPVVTPTAPSGSATPSVVAPAGTQTTPASTSSTATSTNPNLVNLDKYIAKLHDDLTQAGDSPSIIATIEQQVRDDAATKDYQKTYAEYVQAALLKQHATTTTLSLVSRLVNSAIASVEDMFAVHVANAFVPVPFGGFVTYSNPFICNCPPGILTQLFVVLPDAPPPISNIMLIYLNGSQAFPYYTLPAPGVAAVGFYIAGVQSCFTHVGKACILIPSVGQITPIVGSSVLP